MAAFQSAPKSLLAPAMTNDSARTAGSWENLMWRAAGIRLFRARWEAKASIRARSSSIISCGVNGLRNQDISEVGVSGLPLEFGMIYLLLYSA